MESNRLKQLAGIKDINEEREQLDDLLRETIRQISAKDLVYELADDLDDSHLRDILEEVQRKINGGHFSD